MTVTIVFTLSDQRLNHRLATESIGILQRTIELIRDGAEFAPLYDSKGNEVGELKISDNQGS
jgi:hypothetical protein